MAIQLFRFEADFRHVQIFGQFLQFAIIGFTAKGAIVVAGGQQKLQINAAQFADFVAVYAHFHSVFRGHRAGSHNAHALYFHQTQAARAIGGQFRVVAESDDIKMRFADKLQQVFLPFNGNSFTFNGHKLFFFHTYAPGLGGDNRAKFASGFTAPALDTFFGVNLMRLAHFPADGGNRARTLTHTATFAFGGVDFKPGQCLAHPGRAAFFHHMRQVFVPKMFKGGKHRVGRRFAQRT